MSEWVRSTSWDPELDKRLSIDDDRVSFTMVANSRLCPKEHFERCARAVSAATSDDLRMRLIEKIGPKPIEQALNRLKEYLLDLERYEECALVKAILDSL